MAQNGQKPAYVSERHEKIEDVDKWVNGMHAEGYQVIGFSATMSGRRHWFFTMMQRQDTTPAKLIPLP